MSQKDYYKTLGVARDATQDQIKRAYRKMAQTYHPDVNKAPEAESIMKEVNEAYDVLSDATKKAQYDQFGSTGPSYGGYSQQRPGANNQQNAYGYSTFEDLFEEMLRQQRNRQYQQTQYRRSTQQRPVTMFGFFFRIMYAMFVLQFVRYILAFFFRVLIGG